MQTTPDIIQFSGSLDVNTSDQMRRQINDCADKGSTLLLVDCADISFMDSSGLSSLVMGLKLMKTKGGKMALCNLNDQVKMLFQLTGMSKVFEIFPNKEAFEETLVSSAS